MSDKIKKIIKETPFPKVSGEKAKTALMYVFLKSIGEDVFPFVKRISILNESQDKVANKVVNLFY